MKTAILIGLAVLAWMLLAALCNAVLIAAAAVRQRMRELIDELSAEIAAALLAALFAAGRVAGKLLVSLLRFAPGLLNLLWQLTGRRALGALDARLETLRQQRELQRLWREEFSAEYGSFAEFEAAFHGGAARQDHERQAKTESPHSPDPFGEACALFGLPADGGFTLADLTARYRKLMQKAHPEHGGSHERAAQINAARDLVKRRKGWK